MDDRVDETVAQPGEDRLAEDSRPGLGPPGEDEVRDDEHDGEKEALTHPRAAHSRADAVDDVADDPGQGHGGQCGGELEEEDEGYSPGVSV